MTRSSIPGPGPRNLLSDVAGIEVGNAQDDALRSGATVVRCTQPMIASVDVRGGGPGTRETDALQPGTLVDKIDAIVLAGGSVFGLAAADAVCAALAEQQIGRRSKVDAPPVPIVPAAILYDLENGGAKNWGAHPPYAELGRTALANVSAEFALGSVGAGRGAKAGALKGGLGSASIDLGDGLVVAALVAANPVGSVLTPDGRSFWAWPFEIDGEFGGARPSDPAAAAIDPFGPGSKIDAADPNAAPFNTAIAVVACSAELTVAEAKRVAMMAQDGFARAIRPAHTPFDGDTVFAIASGAVSLRANRSLDLTRIGSAASDCLARAVARGVYEAASVPAEPLAYRDLQGS